MRNPPDRAGVLRVDKPTGPTSHDVVIRARRSLGIRRIGHTGTLDPFASGLLLLCVGHATRLSEYLTGLDKRYEAKAMLGRTTDTDDPEGRVVRMSDRWKELSPRDVREALEGFQGVLQQVPPTFSAKKVGGEPVHRKARRGEEVELEAAEVRILDLDVVEVSLPEVRFTVRCSSGTYIRAVARDLGEVLGTGAHLTALRRTAIGSFRVDEAVPAADLHEEGRAASAWLSPAQALAHLPALAISAEEAERIGHGQPLTLGPGSADLPEDSPIRLLRDERLVAVSERRGSLLRPRKVFAGG